MKNLLFILCAVLAAADGYSQRKDTFEVYFPFNKAGISKDAQSYIDRLVFNDTLIHGDKLIILGYADYVGGNGHNDTLSRMRAKNIRAYLGTMGFDKKDIRLCVGKGKIERLHSGNSGYEADRKVQIIIDRVRHMDELAPLPVDARIPVKVAVKRPGGQARAVQVPDVPGEPFDMADLHVNQAFALNHIFFNPGSPIMLPESNADLEKLVAFLNENPTVHIRIEGHVCCLGPVEGLDDRDLSFYRAVTIYNYLIDHGINKERLSSVGLGNLNPVVKDEVTEEDRIKNRRVEIRIMSK